MSEAPKGASGGTKIFETVLYDTPVSRKAPPEGQKYPKLFCITCPKPRKAAPEGQKYPKLTCSHGPEIPKAAPAKKNT